MITIESLTAKQASAQADQFFRPEFQDFRLGTKGFWYGSGAAVLGLPLEVTSHTLDNLLQGLCPDGSKNLINLAVDAERTAAWRIDFSAPQSLSVLWAMASEACRDEIEDAFAFATFETATRVMEASLHFKGLESVHQVSMAKSVLARFACGTSWDQTPNLQSTCFLLNIEPRSQGTAGQFDSDSILKKRDLYKRAYNFLLHKHFIEQVGLFPQRKALDFCIHDVPQNAIRHFFFGQSVAPIRPGEVLGERTGLKGQELFKRWHQLGESIGWGPRQAEAALARAKRLRLYFDIRRFCRDKIQAGARVFESAKVVLQRFDNPTQRSDPNAKDNRHTQNHYRNHSHEH